MEYNHYSILESGGKLKVTEIVQESSESRLLRKMSIITNQR